MWDRRLPFHGNAAPQARLTLYCLPHAGGAASVYRDWPQAFPPAVDVQPVQLPGRESLFVQPLVDDAGQLVDALGELITSQPPGPYALLGHSMGALLAAELTAWLQRSGHRLPELLVVSGRGGARQPSTDRLRRVLELDDEGLLRETLDLGGTDAAALAHPELREIVLEIIRNDLRLCVTYRATFDRLPVRILALGGDHDPWVAADDVHAWHDRTSAGCDVQILPGHHFFLHHRVPDVARAVTAAVGLSTGSLTD